MLTISTMCFNKHLCTFRNKKSFSMADELKKKFQEMQEAKHGRKSEIQVDEMEWIEVSDGA